jgi:hypothetical protein
MSGQNRPVKDFSRPNRYFGLILDTKSDFRTPILGRRRACSALTEDGSKDCKRLLMATIASSKKTVLIFIVPVSLLFREKKTEIFDTVFILPVEVVSRGTDEEGTCFPPIQ